MKIKNFIINTLTVIMLVIIIFPLMNVLLHSLMSDSQSMTSEIIPRPLSLNGYQGLDYNQLILPMFRTLLISIIGTTISLILILLVSFATEIGNFKYSKLIYFCLFIQLTIPTTSIIISRFEVLKNFGLLNTYASLIIAALAPVSSIMIMQSYMKKIPKSMLEIVMISGGTMKDIFFDVVIPFTKQGIVFTAMVTFIGYYNMYVEPLIYITDPSKKTLQPALNQMLGSTSSASIIMPNVQNAAIIVSIAIILILLPYLNKFYIKDSTNGALK